MSNHSIIFILLVLISCGGKPKSGTLEIQIGSLSTTSPTMLYGVRSDGSERWGTKLTEEKTTIALSQGDWKFQAISWSASGSPMSGPPTCAAQVVTIGGEKAQIDLSLSTDTCTGEHWYNGTGYSRSSSATYFGTFNANICPSGVSDAELSSQTACAYPDSTITGFRVTLPEYKMGQADFTTGLRSQCYPVTTSNLQGSLFLPFGSDRSFPMFTKLELFHAPSSSCSGDDCCTGAVGAYNFPTGFGQAGVHRTAVFKDQSYVFLKLEEKSDLSLKISHPLAASYKSCQPVSVSVVDSMNQPEIVSNPTVVDLHCTNCTYHLQNDCYDIPITSVAIAANSPSTSLYVHVNGYQSRMRAVSSSRTLTPGVGRIRALATYAQIDHEFLFSGSIHEIGSQAAVPPFAANDVIIYETRSLNRGKMKINSTMNINLPGDKIYFDFVTLDASGTIVTQQNDAYVTACGNADCNIDFDTYPAVGGNVPPQTDIWFQNFGSGIGWNTQSTSFSFLR